MVIKRALRTIQEFIKLESAAGIVLFVFAILAVIADNSPWHTYYSALQNLPIVFSVGMLGVSSTLIHWVNDGLMALFFFLVSLEIKREIIAGELNSLKKLALPGFAALGGMLVPALIYIACNWHHAMNLYGWAIPTATDIAFALGVLSLLGSRIPTSLKIFLTALAILDDLGAIIIIAIFYTHDLSFIFLGLAFACILLLFILNFMQIGNITIYLLVGIVLWFCVLKSGVHATLAGVALGMAIPLQDSNNRQISPLMIIEKALHPWVAFLVLPIFAFFNAGVSFAGVRLETFSEPIPLGIALGLFLGKQCGVFGAAWLAVKTKLAHLPADVDWLWIYGISLVCGIGFTMSLFIGTLAFNDAETAVFVRLGVILSSIVSGLVGYMVLLLKSKRQ